MIEREARGIHQLGDERLHGMVRGDLVERNGNFLPALPAEGDVDIALGIDRGIAHRMQIVGDLHAQRDRKRRALHAAHAHAHRAAHGAFRNARDQHDLPRPSPGCLRPHRTAPAAACGCATAKPLPRMDTRRREEPLRASRFRSSARRLFLRSTQFSSGLQFYSLPLRKSREIRHTILYSPAARAIHNPIAA